jgi:hypothetical protein
MNINIELINQQIITKPHKNVKKTKNLQKVCIYDFFSINEIILSEKIKNIKDTDYPFFCDYLFIIDDYDVIKIGEIDENTKNILETLTEPNKSTNQHINTKNKYLLLDYNTQAQKSIKFTKTLIISAFQFFFPSATSNPPLACHAGVAQRAGGFYFILPTSNFLLSLCHP